MPTTQPSVTSQVEKIKSILATVETDAAKFDKGNSAAGTRVRKGMQELKKLAQGAREIIVAK